MKPALIIKLITLTLAATLLAATTAPAQNQAKGKGKAKAKNRAAATAPTAPENINPTPAPGTSPFHAHELAATRLPIRPGVPGKTPFWNTHTKRFTYAPAFDFTPVPGAARYKFTVHDEDGRQHTFTADTPWAPLTPIWNAISIGAATLRVDALDPSGATIAPALLREPFMGARDKRPFYRAAIFNGPYRPDREKTNTAAALECLRALIRTPRFQHWLTHAAPYPAEVLNCYPAKEMGASIRGMIALSKITPDKQESADALKIARNIADYLITRLSPPAGSPMAHIPYTFWVHPDKTINHHKYAYLREHQSMLSEPPKALIAYLDLHDLTNDKKYLDAALAAARTYAKIRRPDGTWPVLAHKHTGAILNAKPMIPTWLMFLFNDLGKKHNHPEYARLAADCEQWLLDNPLKTYAWDAQFEDIPIGETYKNMSFDQSSDTAWYLLENHPRDPEKVALAEELLRFIEDHCVVWEKPKNSWYEVLQMPGSPVSGNRQHRNINTWILPAGVEQDILLVNTRATVTIMRAFGKAYQVTGKEIYRAKAESLAGTMLKTQEHHGGGEIETFPLTTKNIIWTNNSVYAALFLLDLDTDIANRQQTQK